MELIYKLLKRFNINYYRGRGFSIPRRLGVTLNFNSFLIGAQTNTIGFSVFLLFLEVKFYNYVSKEEDTKDLLSRLTSQKQLTKPTIKKIEKELAISNLSMQHEGSVSISALPKRGIYKTVFLNCEVPLESLTETEQEVAIRIWEDHERKLNEKTFN